jgi:hypothetical protein
MACEFIVSNLTAAGGPAPACGARPVIGVLRACGDVGWGGGGIMQLFMASIFFRTNENVSVSLLAGDWQNIQIAVLLSQNWRGGSSAHDRTGGGGIVLRMVEHGGGVVLWL